MIILVNKFVEHLTETMLEIVEFNLNKFCILLNINKFIFWLSLDLLQTHDLLHQECYIFYFDRAAG